MAPSSRPDRISLLRKLATIIIGTIEISAAAEIAHHSSPRWLFWPATRMGSVCQSELVRNSANRNSFQMKLRVIMKVAAKPGADIGSTISRQMRHTGTLSTSAASSMSAGKASKKSRISHTTTGIEKAT